MEFSLWCHKMSQTGPYLVYRARPYHESQIPKAGKDSIHWLTYMVWMAKIHLKGAYFMVPRLRGTEYFNSSGR